MRHLRGEPTAGPPRRFESHRQPLDTGPGSPMGPERTKGGRREEGVVVIMDRFQRLGRYAVGDDNVVAPTHRGTKGLTVPTSAHANSRPDTASRWS
jgi:hypothetical protein